MSVRAGRNSSIIAVTLFFVTMWAVFQFVFPYHLVLKERYVLFMSDPSWLASYFRHPAPISFIAGDWLTQFFLIPWVAALVTTVFLILFWAGCGILTALCRLRYPALWALLPTAILAAFMLSPEVPLAILVGACLFAWLFVAAFMIRNKVVRYIAAALLAVLLVPSLRSLTSEARVERPGRESEYDYRIHFKASAGKWDTVERMGRRNPFQSLVTSYYYNISQARNGQLPDGLLKAYQPTYHGLFIPVKPGVPCFKLMASTDALYLAGDYAQAQHSAMLGMTFSPRQRSAAMIKLMADIAFANGDYDTARRYLTMLSKTALYRKWAREGLHLLDTDTASLAVKNDCRDILIQHNDYCTALANLAATSSDGKTATDYLLCLDLLDKNLGNFRRDYDEYYKGKYDVVSVPLLYQEALLMTFDENTSPAEQLSEYRIARSTLDNCTTFLKGNESMFRSSYWFYHKYAQPAR
ncbi:MAG: hypothetical protein IJJ72_06470 [Bacteroidales bacterium]|nr:hypothetical protein [Bacteroidales bacterium]